MSGLTKLHEDLARVVLVERELCEVLHEITTVARGAMPGADAASVTLIQGEKVFTAAYDGRIALDADELQYARGYGPCLDAGRTGQSFLIDNMRTEQRWPDYTRHAARHGIGSALSVPLHLPSTTIGALNSYASRPRAFAEDDVRLAEEVATWVARAVETSEASSLSR